MIPPDQEIYEVEQRLAHRRHEVELLTKETGHRTMQAMSSPGALVGAAVVGFFAGGAVLKRRQHPRPHRRKADKAKATGIAGLLMTGAMWGIRAKFGSPVGLAQFLLAKWQQRRAAQPHLQH